MCDICAAIGGYCGQCDGSYWSEFNAQAEARREAALSRIAKRERQERAKVVAQCHLQWAYLRWAELTCSLFPKQEPTYRDRCQMCGGSGCATCNYWESTR